MQDAYQLRELCQNSDKRLREICETKHLALPIPPMEEDPIYFEEDEDDVKLSILKEQKLNIEEATISEVKREFLKRENDDSDNESWHGEEGNYGGDYDESQDSTNSNLSLDSNGDEKPRKRKKHHNVRQYKCSTCGKVSSKATSKLEKSLDKLIITFFFTETRRSVEVGTAYAKKA